MTKGQLRHYAKERGISVAEAKKRFKNMRFKFRNEVPTEAPIILTMLPFGLNMTVRTNRRFIESTRDAMVQNIKPHERREMFEACKDMLVFLDGVFTRIQDNGLQAVQFNHPDGRLEVWDEAEIECQWHHFCNNCVMLQVLAEDLDIIHGFQIEALGEEECAKFISQVSSGE